MHKEQGRTVESPVEARAGFLDRPVLAVLVGSLALVLILYGFIYFGFSARPERRSAARQRHHLRRRRQRDLEITVDGSGAISASHLSSRARPMNRSSV